jgi:hypothetical protein
MRSSLARAFFMFFLIWGASLLKGVCQSGGERKRTADMSNSLAKRERQRVNRLKKYPGLTRDATQAWWQSLSPDLQQEYVARKVAERHAIRDAQSTLAL